jgi:hypothetical protein
MAKEKGQPIQKMQPPSAEEQLRIAAGKERALRILNTRRAEVNNIILEMERVMEEMKERCRQQQEIKSKAKLGVEEKMESVRKLQQILSRLWRERYKNKGDYSKRAVN